MKRLWRKFRTRRLRGWNPWYSPSMHARDIGERVAEIMREGILEAQQIYERGDPDEIEAFERDVHERIQRHPRPAGVRIGNTVFFPAPYDPITLPEDEWIEED